MNMASSATATLKIANQAVVLINAEIGEVETRGKLNRDFATYRELAPLSVSGWRMSLDISDSTNSGLTALPKKMHCGSITAPIVSK
jgi:hypothetical protein